MPRPRNQTKRRQELITATKDALSRRSMQDLRLRDVADAAGMTPGAILYYYDGLDDLFFAVYERGIDRFCREREEAIATLDDPALELATAIRLGIPPSADDADVRLLYEFEAVAFRNGACAELMHGYVERQVAMYSGVLDRGAQEGVFELVGDIETIAQNIVGLEDAHGVYVLTGHRTPLEVERLVLAYAAIATGAELARLEDCARLLPRRAAPQSPTTCS